MQKGYGCRRGSTGGQCCNDIALESGLKKLYDCLELSHVELDLVILANIQATIRSNARRKKKKESTLQFFISGSIHLQGDVFEPTVPANPGFRSS